MRMLLMVIYRGANYSIQELLWTGWLVCATDDQNRLGLMATTEG
jgi:hypothetical protein